MPDTRLIACHACDMVQRETVLRPGAAARCRRCGVTLYRHCPDSLDRTLALTLSAAILLVIANAFPLVGLEMQGRQIETTLLNALRVLHGQDMEFVAALVFVTTLLFPAAELAALAYILVPLRLGRRPRGMMPIYRLVRGLRPWGMVDVFMLGLLVSLVKLAQIATVVPGVALWSFGGLILLLAAGTAAFEPRELWLMAERKP